MKIQFKLGTTDIAKAIKELEAYKRSFISKVKRLNERLAVIGASVARVEFSNAMYAGDNDVEVSVEVYDGGAKVIASGGAVLFIEFGSGVSNPEHPQSGEFGFSHGTYGKEKGANPKGWVYKGEQGNAGQPIKGRDGVYRTMGNPPAMAMYKAAREIESDLRRIVREVFG